MVRVKEKCLAMFCRRNIEEEKEEEEEEDMMVCNAYLFNSTWVRRFRSREAQCSRKFGDSQSAKDDRGSSIYIYNKCKPRIFKKQNSRGRTELTQKVSILFDDTRAFSDGSGN
jgi:hypothetical protein